MSQIPQESGSAYVSKERSGENSVTSSRFASAYVAPRTGIVLRLRLYVELIVLHLQRNWLEDCAQQNARFQWIAICCAFGAASYYLLPDEPAFVMLVVFVLALAFTIVGRAKRGLSVFPMLLVAAGLVGVTAASLHGRFLSTPVLNDSFSAVVIGRVEQIERRGSVARPEERWRVAVETIEGLESHKTPKRLLLLRKAPNTRFEIGDRVRLRAYVTAPQLPAYPGGFDYGRYLWARAIGGQGYISKGIERWPQKPGRALITQIREIGEEVEQTRADIADYLVGRMAPDPGGLAAALAVGKRDYLSKDVQAALRRSGLAHILAISGLHMALVAMTVFWVVRAAFAMVAHLALNYPIKQWAAFVALISAVCYLVLSGGSVATIRAFFMMSIFLVAILASRPALTTQNLSLALIFLVLTQPYAVIEAGMQMSFAATAALISSYDRIRRFGQVGQKGHFEFGEDLLGRIAKSFLLLGRWIVGIGLTSLIAGFAVLPFSIAHFQQMAPFGIVANLAAMPVLSLVVMPMGLITVLLTPLGLQSWGLLPVEWGLDCVVVIAERVASWSDAELLVVKKGGDFLPFVVFAISVYSIHRRWLMLAAVFPALIALILWWQMPQADLWISQTGRRVAMRDDDGRWQVMGTTRLTLDFKALLRAEGDPRAIDAGHKLKSPNLLGKDNSRLLRFGCDDVACYAENLARASGEKTDLTVAIIRKPMAFAEECSVRDVIISSLPVPEFCNKPNLVVADSDLANQGAILVTFAKPDEKAGEDPLVTNEGANRRLSKLAADRWRLTVKTALPEGWRPWLPERSVH